MPRREKPAYNKIVKVYRNLTYKCWSVLKDERLNDRPEQVFLAFCEFVVQPAGRERVREEKCKNVHAWVKGMRLESALPESLPWREAYYDPYVCEGFQDKETGEPLTEAKYVWCRPDQTVAYC